ncbi:MAG: DUF3298 domain-containing protein [Treponema sp.]|nr:DUF3298 domain-containing protein [Treponema sp.]MEE3313965.1 DUF3298 domain-containing protein [Treponema sp.]
MKKIIFALIGFVLVMAFTSCQSTKKSDKYQMKIIKEEKDYTPTTIEYPEFYDYPELNKALDSFITSSWDEKKNLIAENNRWWLEEGDLSFVQGIHNEYNVDCPKIIVNDYTVSFIISEYIYLCGAAHGSTTYTSFNYDIASKSFKTITDIPWVDLEKLSAYCISSLKTEYLGDPNAEDEWIDKGAAPTLENYSTFCYDGNQLTVFFQQYQVVPYAGGIPEITLTEKDFRAFSF